MRSEPFAQIAPLRFGPGFLERAAEGGDIGESDVEHLDFFFDLHRVEIGELFVFSRIFHIGFDRDIRKARQSSHLEFLKDMASELLDDLGSTGADANKQGGFDKHGCSP